MKKLIIASTIMIMSLAAQAGFDFNKILKGAGKSLKSMYRCTYTVENANMFFNKTNVFEGTGSTEAKARAAAVNDCDERIHSFDRDECPKAKDDDSQMVCRKDKEGAIGEALENL